MCGVGRYYNNAKEKRKKSFPAVEQTHLLLSFVFFSKK